MLSKPKTVKELNQAVFTLIVKLVALTNLVQESYFNICIVNIKLFVLTYFGCYLSMILIFIINALDYLSKGTLVNYFGNFISISKLLTYLYMVKAFSVSYVGLVYPPYLTNCIDTIIQTNLNLLKLSQFILEIF